MKDSSTFSLVIILLLALVVSGAFSLIETALLTFNRSRMKHLQESGEEKAGLLLAMTRRVDKLLSTILLCNNLANVVVATVATVLVVRWLGDEEHVIVISSFIVTAIILVFSEITPKALGVRHSERASLLVARPLWWTLRLLTPVVLLVEAVVKAMLRLAGASSDAHFKGTLFGLAELRSVVKDAENLEGTEASQRDMLVNVIDIQALSVEDIMVPKKDILALNVDDPEDEILSRLRRTQFTKMPLYKDIADNIVGIVSTAQMLSLALGGSRITSNILMEHSRKPLFIPARAGVLNLAGVLRKRRHNMGIVVNEYGETIGLVTTTDLLTEISGEEYHEIPTTHTHSRYWKDGEGNVFASGSAQLRELNRRLNLKLPTDGPKTLNGLVQGWLEEIPSAPSCIEIAGVRMELVPGGRNSELQVKILPRKAGKTRRRRKPG